MQDPSNLRVLEIPDELRLYSGDGTLNLEFIDKVQIPVLMDSLQFSKLIVSGKMTSKEKDTLFQVQTNNTECSLQIIQSLMNWK